MVSVILSAVNAKILYLIALSAFLDSLDKLNILVIVWRDTIIIRILLEIARNVPNSAKNGIFIIIILLKNKLKIIILYLNLV